MRGRSTAEDGTRLVGASTLAPNTMNPLLDLYEHTNVSPRFPSVMLKRDLYGFFVSGLSVIESFCYAMYAMAAMIKPGRFPITTSENKKNVHPRMVAEKFASVFSIEPVTQELGALINHQDYEDLKDVRNVLAHRASPARHHSVTHPVGQESEFGPSLWGTWRLDAHLTADRRRWLNSTLSSLL